MSDAGLCTLADLEILGVEERVLATVRMLGARLGRPVYAPEKVKS